MWWEKYIILKTNNNSYWDLLNRQLENHSKRKMFTKMNEWICWDAIWLLEKSNILKTFQESITDILIKFVQKKLTTILDL